MAVSWVVLLAEAYPADPCQEEHQEPNLEAVHAPVEESQAAVLWENQQVLGTLEAVHEESLEVCHAETRVVACQAVHVLDMHQAAWYLEGYWVARPVVVEHHHQLVAQVLDRDTAVEVRLLQVQPVQDMQDMDNWSARGHSEHWQLPELMCQLHPAMPIQNRDGGGDADVCVGGDGYDLGMRLPWPSRIYRLVAYHGACAFDRAIGSSLSFSTLICSLKLPCLSR